VGIHHLLGMDEKITVNFAGLAHLQVIINQKTEQEERGREKREKERRDEARDEERREKCLLFEVPVSHHNQMYPLPRISIPPLFLVQKKIHK
jgi:hypothetical protein